MSTSRKSCTPHPPSPSHILSDFFVYYVQYMYCFFFFLLPKKQRSGSRGLIHFKEIFKSVDQLHIKLFFWACSPDGKEKKIIKIFGKSPPTSVNVCIICSYKICILYIHLIIILTMAQRKIEIRHNRMHFLRESEPASFPFFSFLLFFSFLTILIKMPSYHTEITLWVVTRRKKCK